MHVRWVRGSYRGSPSEINSLASVNAGAGTSGVNGIQTLTLKGDASTLGVYTIQLTIPASVRIQAQVHLRWVKPSDAGCPGLKIRYQQIEKSDANRESTKSPIGVPVSPLSAVKCYPCR